MARAIILITGFNMLIFYIISNVMVQNIPGKEIDKDTYKFTLGTKQTLLAVKLIKIYT